MVNIEELLKRLQQAETEMDRQWVLLELQMSQMSDEMTSMLWAAAVPHFFDAKVLAALRPELQDRADELYAGLKTLTFVEKFPKYGHNIHELTRDVLLSQLWKQNQAEFLRLSEQLADYFFDREISSEEDVEFSYHEILNEGNVQRGRLLDQAVRWWDYHQIERIQTALQRLSEHEKAGRLDEFGNGFLLHLNGLLKSKTADYKEAELYFSRAEAIYKNIELRDSRYITTLLRDISTNKENQGDNKSAISICEQALKISEEQFGENHPDTAISLNNLAMLYQDTGRAKEAEPLFLRALKISEEQFGENHPDTAISLNPDTAISLNNLAGLYQATGRAKEAEPLFLRALKIREEQFGENHPNTAVSLGNLAGLYEATGRAKEAGPLYLQALKIIEEQLGENHPNTAISLNNLAGLYQATGRTKEAEPLYLRALKIREEQFGENHPNTALSLNNLAGLYQATGRAKEAEPLCLRALKIYEEQFGENHPDTATSLNDLATLYQKQERHLEAIAMLEKWLRIKKERQETRNQYFAERICTLGKLYERCKQFPQAVATYEEALSIFDQVLGSKNPRTLVLKGELKRLRKKVNKKQGETNSTS